MALHASPHLRHAAGLFRCLAAAAIAVAATAAAAQSIAVDVESAQAAYDSRTNQPLITFKMTETSARLFAELTANNVGRKMEIRVDGRALMAPVIREPILGGSGTVSDPSWTIQQARDVAERISTGRAKIEFQILDN